MCGIAGIIDYRNREKDISILKSMLRIINYRGPEESGIYNSPHASLGHVRLKLLIHESGKQPSSDASGRYYIVMNGEIFNYKELGKELIKKGYNINTNSDTEVLVQLYAIMGNKCLELLNGQFAFAIWDRNSEELFIARDRVGICPLFYHHENGVFSFASEIKSLFQQKDVTRELSFENLSQIFTFWTTITPNTPFKNIFELSPGHYAIFNRKEFKTKKYFELDFGNTNLSLSLPDALEEFNYLFTDAVKLRLNADVEIAAYLSGGIDSSATVSYIKDTGYGPLNTFSLAFDEKPFDESNYQDEAVSSFNTRHRTFTCTAKDIAEVFPNVVWHSETPMTRTAPAPMMLLSKLVKNNRFKAVISGEGSDEILGGYDIFKETVIRRFWASQPESSIRPMLLKRLYPYIPLINNAGVNALKMFFGYKLEDVENPFYSHLLRWNNSNHIKKHFSAYIKNKLSNYSPSDELFLHLPEKFNSWDHLSKAQWLEITIFMSGYLLSTQGDRMIMANSVEGRYPFLDHRLIEFCTKLPAKFKINGLTEKYLLKKLLKDKIPANILKRTKQPYRAPVKNVFLSNSKPEYVTYMLSKEFTEKAGIFDFNSLSQVLARIDKTGLTTEIDDMLLTSVISTHLLYNQFIEKNDSEFRTGELKNLIVTEYF